LYKYFVQVFNADMSRSIAAPTTPQGVRARRAVAAAARPDRKQAILLAAEKLFAQHGYHAVAIRDIAVEAGVPLALVGYYYGQKHELFHAIFEHWGHSIEARLAALRAIDTTQPGRETLTLIIEAFTGPVITLRASAEGEYYALLVARELYHARAETDRILRGLFDPLAHAFIDALQRSLPHATRGQVAWVYQFALGALLHHLTDARVERLSGGECRANDPAAAPMLVAFIVGGIRAALPEPAPSVPAPKKKAPLRRTRRPA
jgi:AcrR family transcriptional regulator